MKTLVELHRAAVTLASACMCEPPCSREDAAGSCIQHEERRPLDGYRTRPFSLYDQGRLCDACLAWWAACIAEQALNRCVQNAIYDGVLSGEEVCS